MLVFYGDDSGSSPRDGVCLVGGYLATQSTWFYDIEIPWRRALAEDPQIHYFKAFECEKLVGEFKGWDRLMADEKLERLVGVVASQAVKLREFSSSIRWSEFENSVTGAVRSVYNHPYYFCVHGVVSLIAREYLLEIAKVSGVPTRATRAVAYAFDLQAQQAEMSKQYHHVGETVDSYISSTMGSISFYDDLEVVPLQVSDLIAWHLRRDILKPKRDLGVTRPALVTLRKHYAFETKEARWNPNKLEEFCDKVDAGLKVPHLWD
ncbi:MAG TPA: hypothetical protein VGN17_03930 [Bryobacteraceae bacterium]|jgi:hypothetical protein